MWGIRDTQWQIQRTLTEVHRSTCLDCPANLVTGRTADVAGGCNHVDGVGAEDSMHCHRLDHLVGPARIVRLEANEQFGATLASNWRA